MRKRARGKVKTGQAQHKELNALHNDIFFAAMHEAGHAFAYAKLGIGVEYVTIERKRVMHNGQLMLSSGFTQPKPRKLSRETIMDEAVCVMAGPASEDSINGTRSSGSQGDIDNLRNYALTLGLPRDEAVELVHCSYRVACALIDDNLTTVKKIAFELMTKGRIEEAVLLEIINNHS
jgi:hypothetical protein